MLKTEPLTQLDFVAIDPLQADRLRSSPEGLTVIADSHPGYPCRQCMTDAIAGEEMILVPHNPFEAICGVSPFTCATPIYLHKFPCTPYASNRKASSELQPTVPVPTVQMQTVQLPTVLVHRKLALRGFDSDHLMQDAVVVDGADLIDAARGLLDREEIQYLQVHNAAQGCWHCRVERLA